MMMMMIVDKKKKYGVEVMKTPFPLGCDNCRNRVSEGHEVRRHPILFVWFMTELGNLPRFLGRDLLEGWIGTLHICDFDICKTTIFNFVFDLNLAIKIFVW